MSVFSADDMKCAHITQQALLVFRIERQSYLVEGIIPVFTAQDSRLHQSLRHRNHHQSYLAAVRPLHAK